LTLYEIIAGKLHIIKNRYTLRQNKNHNL